MAAARFHRQLDSLEEKIQKFQENPATKKQVVDADFAKDISTIRANVVLFQSDDKKHILLYPEINTKIEALTKSLKNLEHNAYKEAHAKKNIDDIRVISSPAPRVEAKVDSKKSHSTSFSLLHFFSCHSKKENHATTEKTPLLQTSSKKDESTSKTNANHRSFFSNVSSYFSSLFCCFGKRQTKGYSPIATESPTVTPRYNR